MRSSGGWSKIDRSTAKWSKLDGRKHLVRVKSPTERSDAVETRRTNPADDELSWDDVRRLCDGLVLALLPLKAATQEITQRYDLGPRGGWILTLIAAGVRFPMDIAQTLRASRALIAIELRRLTRAGLIETIPGAADRRRSELGLTALGVAASQEVRDSAAHMVRRTLASYSAGDVRMIAQALQDIGRA